MSGFRREGWPILLPQGWHDMSRAERRAWWDDVWNRRVKPEFLVPPRGRPDAGAWSGPRIARRVLITCRYCAYPVARVYDHAERVVVTVGREQRSTLFGLRCPDHGRVRIPWDVVERALSEARQEGRVVTREATPRC